MIKKLVALAATLGGVAATWYLFAIGAPAWSWIVSIVATVAALALLSWRMLGRDPNQSANLAQWLSVALAIIGLLIPIAIARPVKVTGTVTTKPTGPTFSPVPALATTVSAPAGGWDTAHVTVTVARAPAPGDVYWLMAEYSSTLGYDVYAARAKVDSRPGVHPVDVGLAGASEGSIRFFYVVEATPAADVALTENSKHDNDWKWNIHRTALPSRSWQVSNRVAFTKAH